MRPARSDAAARLLLACCTLVGVVVAGAGRLGPDLDHVTRPRAWTTPPAGVALEALWALTVVAGIYLVAVLGLVALARILPHGGRLTRAVVRAVPSPLRPLVGLTVGMAILASSTSAASATASGSGPPAAGTSSGGAGATGVRAAGAGTGPAPLLWRVPAVPPPGAATTPSAGAPPPTAGRPPATGGPPAAGTPPARPAAGRATATVRAGDSLWSIAAQRVAATGAGADDATVARYWEELIRANPQFADPDLILPGQVVWLPAGP